MKLPHKINWLVIALPILLFSLGFVTLFSTVPDFAKNQLLFFVFAIILYILFSVFDYRILGYFSRHIYVITLILLILTVVIGKEVLGSSRWLHLGIFTIQPSEFAKIVAVIFISYSLSSKNNSISNFKTLMKITVSILLLALFVFLQPDLGTSIIIFTILLGIFWYSGLKKIYFLLMILLVGVFSSPVWNLLKDYQKERILVFLNPTLDVLGSGYNVLQSTIAIGSGQLLGRGFGRGTQTHLLFLPVFWTDFIFASFSEEWGFFGVFILITLYSLLLFSILNISVNSKDSFGSMLSIGVFIIFFVQFVVNVGMNLGLMPVTGIPLPLISYGGSSLITSAILLGLVQSVYIHEKA